MAPSHASMLFRATPPADPQLMEAPVTIPSQAPDYIRTDDGATMRETVPGEFVNLAVLIVWGFRNPDSDKRKTSLSSQAPKLDSL